MFFRIGLVVAALCDWVSRSAFGFLHQPLSLAPRIASSDMTSCTYTAAVRVWVRGARNGLLVFDMERSADLLRACARQ